MGELFQQIVSNPIPALLIIGNLIVIESLLSVDNAAVLATMVMDLPKEQRQKALRYGIIGAYLFRGVALLFASFLIKFWFLKPLGGAYLLYLVWDWWKGKQTEKEEDDFIDKQGNWIYRLTIKYIGSFWATVALVEVMDMTFSIDNVFGAVAFTNNIILIWIGVFIGILAMRFVAQWFVHLMEKYDFLETCAFVVIGLLGVKLVMSLFEHFLPASALSSVLESENADWYTSGITVAIFLVPILTSLFFNYPKKQEVAGKSEL